MEILFLLDASLPAFFSVRDGDQDTIPPKWLLEDYWQMLTSQEKSHFDRAVSDLTSKGLIEKVNGSIPTLRLTDKGADLIC